MKKQTETSRDLGSLIGLRVAFAAGFLAYSVVTRLKQLEENYQQYGPSQSVHYQT